MYVIIMEGPGAEKTQIVIPGCSMSRNEPLFAPHRHGKALKSGGKLYVQGFQYCKEKEYSYSGMEAITWLAGNTADLILLDYEMPITTGPQVLQMI